MRIKRVNRYYCDFCKKAGCSGGHMSRHEKHCTMNPNRDCRVCKNLLKQDQPLLADIIVLLPDPEKFKKDDGCGCFSYPGLAETIKAVLPKVREASGECPVCILAAFRQKGIHLNYVDDFDFKKEMDSIWEKITEDNYAWSEDSF